MPATASRSRKRAAAYGEAPPAKRTRTRAQQDHHGERLGDPGEQGNGGETGGAGHGGRGPRKPTAPPRAPSEDWGPIDPANTPRAIMRLVSTANWPFLCDLALKHHTSRSDETLTCTANLERVASGVFNVVIELSFSDGTFWVARVRLPDDDADHEEEEEEEEEEEDAGEESDDEDEGEGGNGEEEGGKEEKQGEEEEKVGEKDEAEKEKAEDEAGRGAVDEEDDNGGSDGHELDRETEMLSEIATMRLVAEKTSIPVPQVYCSDHRQTNPFGFPYMLMSVLPGKTLKGPLAFVIPDNFQPKVASQMADYIQQLSKITFSEIGRLWAGSGLDEDPHIIPFPSCGQNLGPFNSSAAYFRGMHQALSEALAEEYGEDPDWPQWLRLSKLQAEAIPWLVCPKLRRGPFPLWHRDFHFKNILVDDEYNITGVLDWTGARVAPWEDFAVYGDILTLAGNSDEENQPILDFRAVLVAALRKLESEQGCRRTPLVADLMASGHADAVSAWAEVAPDGEQASEQALHLLRLLHGAETTFENYNGRRRKLSRRPVWQ